MSQVPDGLTQEQWDLVIRYRDEWIEIGLSTAPADKATAERAITEMYSLLDRPRPAPQFLWVESPNEAHLLMSLLYETELVNQISAAVRTVDREFCKLQKAERQTLEEVLEELRIHPPLEGGSPPVVGIQPLYDPIEMVEAIVERMVNSTIPLGPLNRNPIEIALTQLWPSKGVTTLEGVVEGLLKPVKSVYTFSFMERVASEIVRVLHATIRANYAQALNMSKFWGQNEAYWIGHYLTLRDSGLVQYDDDHSHRLDLWADVARSAGWWWPFERLVVISGRPTVMNMEIFAENSDTGRRRVHCADGPSVRYADGWEMYAWHGTRVPEAVIRGTWTSKEIMAESNLEVRRCAIEVMGWDEFVVKAGLEFIATAPDPGNEGFTLDLYDVPDGLLNFSARVLLCTNATVERDGTRRRFGLTVPADINDPIAAAAWTFNVPVEQYQQLQHAY